MSRESPTTSHHASAHLFGLWGTVELRLSHSRSGPPLCRGRTRRWPAGALVTLHSALILNALLLSGLLQDSAGAATLATPSRSTTIALTSDETRLVVNREANSV
jgi:hypothetical protein